MRKYWFYINPYCFIWDKGKKTLIYDSHSGKGLELRSNERIKWLINQLNDLNNLYCIELTEELLAEDTIKVFISEIQNFNAGNLIPVVPEKRKPAFLVPFLNLQEDINKVRKDPDRSLGKDIIKNLHELNFFIDAASEHDSNVFEQFAYQSSVDGGLLFSDIKVFLDQVKTSSVSIINVHSRNFLKYPELDSLINELDRMHIIKTFFLPFRYFPDKISELKFLESPQFRLKVLIETGSDPQSIIELSKKLKKISTQVEWVFSVSSKQEFAKVNSIIERSELENVEIKPFYNGKNIKFFKESIFLTREDLLNSGLSKREIFAHQVLNTNDFGKLTILPDGKVHANVNYPALGKINDPIKKMVFYEMDKGTSWRRIRDIEPCKSCVYQWLCPSLENAGILTTYSQWNVTTGSRIKLTTPF